MDAQAPPESRVAPYYPVEGRFEAPHLNIFNAPDFPLVNKIGLIMEEVVLDQEAAADILSTYRPAYVKESYDFKSLFSSDCEDVTADNAVDRYFPAARRNEVPVIDINGNTEEDGSVILAVGTIVPDGVEDGASTHTEAESIAAREGCFWKKGVAVDAEDAIERNFGTIDLSKAPVISFGELSVSLGMEEITGQAAAGVYADRYMQAPGIRMKAPMGDWDSSGFLEVCSEEVQLPLLQACSVSS